MAANIANCWVQDAGVHASADTVTLGVGSDDAACSQLDRVGQPREREFVPAVCQWLLRLGAAGFVRRNGRDAELWMREGMQCRGCFHCACSYGREPRLPWGWRTMHGRSANATWHFGRPDGGADGADGQRT